MKESLMYRMISCLVDRQSRVYVRYGLHPHTQLAEISQVKESKCLKYWFCLTSRTFVRDFRMDRAPFEPKQSHDQAAQEFFNQCAGTPKKLMAFVQRGNWDDGALWRLLTDSAQAECDKACADAWAERVKACAAAKTKRKKACVAAWAECCKVFCGATEEEYNKACAAADAECYKACAAAEAKWSKVLAKIWLRLFKDPENRIKIWR